MSQDPVSIAELPQPKVANWQALYEPNASARCIRDSPPMRGFGRDLKKGDIVKVNSVCWSGSGYEISVAEELAFYVLEDYFEAIT